MKDHAVVLMYHRILTQQELSATNSSPGIVILDTTFRKQMRYVQRRYTVLSAQDYIRHFELRKPFMRAALLITFDDGWDDNFRTAFPVLKEYELPALIFLSAGFIGTKNVFWQEKSRALIKRYVDQVFAKPEKLAADQRILSDLGLKTESLKNPLTDELIETCILQLKQRSETERELLINELENRIGQDNNITKNVDRFMTWNEVRHLAGGGIEFGSHTIHHKILTQIDTQSALQEICNSKKIIEDKLQIPVTTFAYPNGNYDDQLQTMTRECGYQAAFTTRPGFVKSTDNVYEIKRVNIHEDMTRYMPMFECKILGIF